ncbi:hypothetical protein FRUB_03121 [Fimbriiglobus ruber]|uniref:Uncharacterized protein n=2 Tax=Fimbriiglobus ruber TaxID=1908690 RepID=A0A225DQ73_9BACT|nr:hypothetical protein FRUB_03121 [Fimbriiglobus ruber]
MTDLISGIMSDAQTLFKQQVAMLRAEVRDDVRRSLSATKYIGFGATLASIGGLFVLVGFVLMLARYIPALEPWAWWAIVGGTLLIGGGLAIYAGKRTFEQINPDKTLNALEENLTWATNRQK